jgi:5-methylcytosine-specific restriction enzyme subunit McrC
LGSHAAYLRRVLQAFANEQIAVHDGNAEGKKPLYDDRADPPAQPDIVLLRRDTNQHVIVEVKYKDKPDRGDVNQAISYALTYRSNRVVLVHQRGPGANAGLRRLGIINNIAVDAYAYDLGRVDIDAEETAFADSLLAMLTAETTI